MADSAQFTALAAPTSSEPTAAETAMRKHHTPAVRGDNWDLLTAVIAASEQKNYDMGQAVEDQLHLASATGKYLDRHAAKVGQQRPSLVGMSDKDFRKLVVSLQCGGVTPKSFLATLEVYYGFEATHAHVTSGVAEPFIVEDGSTLTLRLDGRTTVDVVFSIDDFDTPSAATSLDVSGVLNRAFQQAGVRALALPQRDPETNYRYVAVYTGTPGIRGSVEVLGGTAQDWVEFPTLLTPSIQVGQSWTLTKSGTRMRFSTSGALTWARYVRAGDYVLVRDAAFLMPNTGSYFITDVQWSAVSNSAWFEVENASGTAEVVVLTSATGLRFFRPTRASLHNQRAAYLKQSNGVVILPATSSAVTRTSGKAAHIRQVPPLSVTSATLDSLTGIVTVVTSGTHDMSVGQQAFVDGLLFGTGATTLFNPNGIASVLTVPTASSFTYRAFSPPRAFTTTPGSNSLVVTSAAVVPVAAPTITGPGAVVYDPTGSVALTEVVATSQEAIEAGHGIRTITVNSAASFPEERGWLVFGLGYDYQTAPVPYFGRGSATQLLLDPTFVFPTDIPSGTRVNLLSRPGPVESTIEDGGAFWLTPSPAGRVAAGKLVGELAAAGVEVKKTVLYPGDRGLGNEGQPTSGQQRLSDVVWVFGGDDLDAEVKAARES